MVAIAKNLRFEDMTEASATSPVTEYITEEILSPLNVGIMAIAYPLVMLPLFRFYLLRKARGLNRIGITKKVKGKSDLDGALSESQKGETVVLEQEGAFYGTDISNALMFWRNQPLLDAYFSHKDQLLEKNEMAEQ